MSLVAVVHCEACRGKARRRDLARVHTDAVTGEPQMLLARVRDGRGFRIYGPPANELYCPTHGPLDLDAALGLLEDHGYTPAASPRPSRGPQAGAQARPSTT